VKEWWKQYEEMGVPISYRLFSFMMVKEMDGNWFLLNHSQSYNEILAIDARMLANAY
jgi:hypothetical protein